MNDIPPDKQNIYVLIVTYNPDDRLIRLMEAITGEFENILIVDNNSHFDINLLINGYKYHLIKNNENQGAAAALNIGARFAISKGARWLLMLDQDTIPTKSILLIYNQIFSKYPFKERIGQIGVSFNNTGTEKTLYKSVTTLMTSGTLLSLEVYNQIGSFRNDLFIDCVDYEYSLRIKREGYINLLSPEIAIDHRLGSIKKKKFMFISVSSSNHPPQRRYFMARNHVILSLEYFRYFPIWVLKINYHFIKSLLSMIFVDDHKTDKFKMSFKGLKDGISSKIRRSSLSN